jgi:hypothetical protein
MAVESFGHGLSPPRDVQEDRGHYEPEVGSPPTGRVERRDGTAGDMDQIYNTAAGCCERGIGKWWVHERSHVSGREVWS